VILVNDAGDSATTLALAGSGSTSNSQCTIRGAGSSATVSGNTLTLTLVIQFNATTFSGRKVVYMAARDSDQNNSGWQPMGTYAVGATPATNPMVVSLTPNSGTTNTATLTVTYRDATVTSISASLPDSDQQRARRRCRLLRALLCTRESPAVQCPTTETPASRP
jgi:hypothetical protein